MKYMLDTNICIYIIKKKPAQALRRLQKISIPDICLSSIALSELEYGVEKSQKKEQNRIALLHFVSPLSIMAYDADAAQHYGEIRAELEKVGQPIGSMDLLIAAHARSSNLIMVTHNVKEFARVPGLKIEDWT